MPTIGVSSWSLRHALGPMYVGLAVEPEQRRRDETFGRGSLALLDFPDAARAVGIRHLDICHFHFPRTDTAYLHELRARVAAADIQSVTLLIDDGDISAGDPATQRRDLARIEQWIDVAAQLGARLVRVVAGETETGTDRDAIRRSADGLCALARYAQKRSVGVLTENWRALAMSPRNLLAILDAADGAVGLVADFGNYKGATKYDDLRAILPRATTIHAHATAAWMRPGTTDTGDLRRCLDLAQGSGFAGTYVLIFDGDGVSDEWAGIARMADIVGEYC